MFLKLDFAPPETRLPHIQTLEKFCWEGYNTLSPTFIENNPQITSFYLHIADFGKPSTRTTRTTRTTWKFCEALRHLSLHIHKDYRHWSDDLVSLGNELRMPSYSFRLSKPGAAFRNAESQNSYFFHAGTVRLSTRRRRYTKTAFQRALRSSHLRCLILAAAFWQSSDRLISEVEWMRQRGASGVTLVEDLCAETLFPQTLPTQVRSRLI